ncbi:MAG: cell division protein ZapA [Tissierellaceae bacterium]
MKKKINIIIDGRNFTVVGSESEEYVINLAYYVDKKIKEVSGKNDKLCQTMSATLAALNIADELQRTKGKLEELESQAKGPLERYDDLTSELEDAKATIRDLQDSNRIYKEQLLNEQLGRENAVKEIEKNKRALELKEKELVDNQKMIKSLQDKIFDNQIELIETKKELGEIIRRLDDKRNLFSKEEA